jgi:hypothetical protein
MIYFGCSETPCQMSRYQIDSNYCSIMETLAFAADHVTPGNKLPVNIIAQAMGFINLDDPDENEPLMHYFSAMYCHLSKLIPKVEGEYHDLTVEFDYVLPMLITWLGAEGDYTKPHAGPRRHPLKRAVMGLDDDDLNFSHNLTLVGEVLVALCVAVSRLQNTLGVTHFENQGDPLRIMIGDHP